MKILVVVITLVASTHVSVAQNAIEWNGVYQLKLTDFKSPSTKVGETNIYSLHTAANMNFSFQMSTAEFIFTKNFNSKVTCILNRDAASLIAPDSATATQLVNFARYEFDLCELYARKFRKLLYEGKGAFSNVNFFKPIYDDVQHEFVNRHSAAAAETDLGRNEEKLAVLHQQVLKELEAFKEFCKTCTPPKKKK
ncbi:MAG: hypothetical protein ACKO96_47830 [Flammeovirgaceae bacterium]